MHSNDRRADHLSTAQLGINWDISRKSLIVVDSVHVKVIKTRLNIWLLLGRMRGISPEDIPFADPETGLQDIPE
jgi:hypothetical protein